VCPQSRCRGRQSVYRQAIRSPTSLQESRVYSQKKFLSRVQNDFCNKIGTNRRSFGISLMPAMGGSCGHCGRGLDRARPPPLTYNGHCGCGAAPASPRLSEREDPLARSVVSFLSPGSPRTERGSMSVNIGRRELIAALGSAAWPRRA